MEFERRQCIPEENVNPCNGDPQDCAYQSEMIGGEEVLACPCLYEPYECPY